MKSEDRFPVPRLKVGQCYIGPEHAGCSCTGRRAMVLRSRLGQYVVGTELDVDRAREIIYVQGFPKGSHIKDTEYRRGPSGRNRKVHRTIAYTYKSRQSAVKRFHEMNQKVLDFNARERQEVAQKMRASKNGDVESAISLGLDHGV